VNKIDNGEVEAIIYQKYESFDEKINNTIPVL